MTDTSLMQPFLPPAAEDDRPAVAARLEVLEVHGGKSYDDRTPLAPNEVRVNGVSLWAPVDDPIVVQEIAVDGKLRRAVVVTLRLQVRALKIGAPRVVLPPPGDARKRHFAVVELPMNLGDDDTVTQIGHHAYVDGHKLLLAAPGPSVERVVPGDPRQPDMVDRTLVVVTLPLLCRSVVFDDEVDPTRGDRLARP